MRAHGGRRTKHTAKIKEQNLNIASRYKILGATEDFFYEKTVNANSLKVYFKLTKIKQKNFIFLAIKK